MLRTFFVLQKNNDQSVYYKEKRGSRNGRGNYGVVLVETTFKDAKKFKSIKEIHNALEKTFSNSIKAYITDLSAGFKIIKHTEQITLTESEESPAGDTADLIAEVISASKMVNNTHYSTIELLNKLRKDPSLADYKYILSTQYDRMATSKLMEMFELHELEPIKYKGNFAFDREEYWTAAKLICDVPYKSYNLATNDDI